MRACLRPGLKTADDASGPCRLQVRQSGEDGNPNIVVAAAAELPRLSLADALLVLLFARARAADRGGCRQVAGAIRRRGPAGAGSA
jgi:hypothetical protein